MKGRDAALAIGLVLTTLVWGSAFTAIKVVVRVLHPVDLAIVRFLLASLGFLVVLLVLRRRGAATLRFSRRQWGGFALLGLTGIVGYHVALNVGEDWLTQTASEDTAAILSAFLISTNSLFTMLLSPWVTRERLGARRIVGIFISLAGTALLVLWGRGTLVDRASLVGILIVLAAPLSWAIYSVVAKRVLRRLSPFVVSAWATLLGTLFLLPLASRGIVDDLVRLTPVHWLWILLLSAGATFFGYLVWAYALHAWDASRVSTFVYLVPLFGVLVATLVEGERLTPQIAAGGGLILVGLYAANSAARPRPQEGRSGAPQT